MGKSVCKAFPDCGRPVMARGLCQAHFNEDRRGEAFRPVKSILVGGSRMTSIQVRVNYETRRALGFHPNKQARLVLEEWAKEQAKKQAAHFPSSTMSMASTTS